MKNELEKTFSEVFNDIVFESNVTKFKVTVLQANNKKTRKLNPFMKEADII